MTEFKPFPKMARLSRECIITEKLDGTNAQICIERAEGDFKPEYAAEYGVWLVGDYTIRAGSRTRWIWPGKQSDNYGFAAWVSANREELIKLGPGCHFGEWWGAGIQRNYGITEKRFSLFNASHWSDPVSAERPPACCSVVPTLYRGIFDSAAVNEAMFLLKLHGSKAAPSFFNPEGIIVFHIAAGIGFKKTFDDTPKGVDAQSPS